ncbi:MAG: SDR family NAD(P)-dependent oxidoreductase [Alphaproteobacteria bacterium]|nr:SDR family NAD(P)-dependent oxidoreductase [Alphaproteobacteria bacterium]MBM3820411.1 SDR family NAD(P)-dependent oxidoreductase [Acidimicrobiia bacterium]
MANRIAGKRILVTGGTGFIGSALVRSLVAQDAAVRTLDNDSRGAATRLADLGRRIEHITGDVRDPAVVRAAVRGVDCVCHLAYINGTQHFYSHPELVLEVGVKGMMNVLDACVAEGVRELVLASSSEVYQSPPEIPTDETVPLSVPDVLNPRYSYGGGKIISELLAVNYGRKFFDRTLIFRPHNVYGPDMGREHVIPQFILRVREAAARQPAGVLDFPIQGTGDETRAFIYIDDFTRGLLCVLDAGESPGVYHIGTGREVAMGALAHMVAAACGREIRLVPGELLPGSTLRRCPDVERLEALGFRPAVSLEEGLRRTVEWYTQHCATRTGPR